MYPLKFLQKYILKSQGKSIYNTSFNEGIEFNQIEIISSSKIMIIEDNENLKSIVQQPGTKEYLYRLIFENKKSLRDFKKSIEGIKTIKKIDKPPNTIDHANATLSYMFSNCPAKITSNPWPVSIAKR